MEVRLERSYHLKDEDDTEVDKENVAQGSCASQLSPVCPLKIICARWENLDFNIGVAVEAICAGQHSCSSTKFMCIRVSCGKYR